MVCDHKFVQSLQFNARMTTDDAQKKERKTATDCDGSDGAENPTFGRAVLNGGQSTTLVSKGFTQ
jgi:hypothetical protein